MREILFRGKRVDSELWVEGSLVNNIFCRVETYAAVPYIINPDEYEEYCCMEDIGELAVEVLEETVGQFTGLLDKNGKKIFEGDIVVLSDDTVLPGYRYAISFHDGAFCVGLHDGELFSDFCSVRDGMAQARRYDKEFSICVIGNIHDNSELLEA